MEAASHASPSESPGEIARRYGRLPAEWLPSRARSVSALAAEADANLGTSLGRRRQAQEDAEVGSATAWPTPGDHGLRRRPVVVRRERLHHALPASVLIPRQVADQLPIDLDGDRLRVVRVIGLGDKNSNVLDPDLLIASATADLDERRLVVRGADDRYQRVTLDKELVHAASMQPATRRPDE